MTETMTPHHDSFDFLGFIVTQLRQGKAASVSADEFEEHLTRLRRYVEALERNQR